MNSIGTSGCQLWLKIPNAMYFTDKKSAKFPTILSAIKSFVCCRINAKLMPELSVSAECAEQCQKVPNCGTNFLKLSTSLRDWGQDGVCSPGASTNSLVAGEM